MFLLFFLVMSSGSLEGVAGILLVVLWHSRGPRVMSSRSLEGVAGILLVILLLQFLIVLLWVGPLADVVIQHHLFFLLFINWSHITACNLAVENFGFSCAIFLFCPCSGPLPKLLGRLQNNRLAQKTTTLQDGS